MNIHFYNYWHSGDLHVSRAFINYITDNVKADNYYYHHSNSDKILSDNKKIQVIYTNKLDTYDQQNKDSWKIDGNDYYINTWYRAGNDEYFNSHGISIITLFLLFKNTIKTLFDISLDGYIIDYLPYMDFSKFNLSEIKNFISSNDKKKVLICNNDVLSGQSVNFDFNPIIENIARKNNDIQFIITNRMGRNVNLENVMYFDNIYTLGGNNLNEIGFISKFCDVIIGRLSGPSSFTGIKDNYFDEKKIFLNFIKPDPLLLDGSFGVSELLPKDYRSKFIVSTNLKENSIIGLINDTIRYSKELCI